MEKIEEESWWIFLQKQNLERIGTRMLTCVFRYYIIPNYIAENSKSYSLSLITTLGYIAHRSPTKVTNEILVAMLKINIFGQVPRLRYYINPYHIADD